MQSNMQNLTDRRYHSIDFVKGICILFIIITHYTWEDAERLKYLFPFWIDMAVPIFMVVSGFVYTKSFQKNHINTIENAYRVDSFLCKIIRYSVPFTMVFMLEEIVGNVTGAVHHNITQIGVLFLNGGFGPGSYYYPIMIQLIFYFPVLFCIIKKYNFSGLILCAFINLFYEILKYSYGMNEECYRLLLFRYTLLIAYGCYLAMGNFKRHNILSVICMCIGITYIIICKYMRIVPLITNFWTGTSLWASLFIIPISAPIILNKASNRFVETLGRASYDIFLIQMVYYNGAGFIYSLVDKRWLQLLINIVICVSMGLIFYCIETPITKTINDKAYGIWHNYGKQYQ